MASQGRGDSQQMNVGAGVNWRNHACNERGEHWREKLSTEKPLSFATWMCSFGAEARVMAMAEVSVGVSGIGSPD